MSSSNGFRRCDGFAGSIPQNFINANMPVCPMCGSNDPYWLLKDKMEWTAHRIMFRCSKCGCILSATNGDFTGATKSTAFAVLSTAGAVNALTKKAQGKDVKTVYMRVEDVGDAQVSSALTGKELPIDEFKAMAQAFSMPTAAPASAPAADNQSEFKVSYGQPAPAPVAEPAPAPAEEPEFKVSYGQPAPAPVAEPAPAPAEEPEFKVSYGQPAPAPVAEPAAAPVEEPEFKVSYGQPAPAAEPAPVFHAAPAAAPAAEPEFRVQYAAPVTPAAPAAPAAPAVPAPARKKYVLKERMPVFAIIMMGMTLLFAVLRAVADAINYLSGIRTFYNLVNISSCSLMLVGMILHRKKGQVLTAVGSLCMALVSFISVVTSLGNYVSWTILIDVFAMAAFVIAGIYYLTKAPVLGMPLKLIAFLLFVTLLTVHLLSMGRYLFRGYLPGYIIVSWLGEYFLAVTMIIYTPFKRNRV